MVDVFVEQTLTSNTSQGQSKPSTLSTFLIVVVVATLSSCVAGACIGFGWRIDKFAFLGVIGFAIFLTVQVYLKSFLACLVQALLTGYLAYFVANPWLNWTIDNLMDDAPSKALIVIHGVHLLHGGMYCLFAAAWWVFRRWVTFGLLAAPALWLILESVYPAMFPMRQGCLIVQTLPLVQIASVFGVAGATLQVFAIASLLPLGYLSWCNRSRVERQLKNRQYKLCMIVILVATSINVGWGSYRVHRFQQQAASFSGEYLTVGVLQGDTEYAASYLRFAERSRQLTECDLMLWPECALGKYQTDLVDFSNSRLVTKKSIGIGFQFRPLPDPDCYLLGGGYSWTPKAIPPEEAATAKKYGFPVRPKMKEKYVSAFLLDPQEQLLGRHDKIELMAGGEYVPFADMFPWLNDWLLDGADDGLLLSRGLEASPVGEVEGVSVGALLCCEDMYPRLSRKMTQQGADLIVCLTNGMSFNSDIALRQHFNIGRFRAIENNRYFARCGSHGVSGLITPDGTVQQRLPCFEEQNATLKVPKQKRATSWFSYFGDTLTPASYLILLILVVVSGFKAGTPHASKITSDA